MKYILPVLVILTLSVASCASPSPSSRKLDIVLRNTTPHPIEIRAKAGLLSRTIRLEPGQRWNGWVPTFVTVQSIEIEMAGRETR
jgi:hypothetical protein